MKISTRATLLLLCLLLPARVLAGASTIAEVDGSACLGDDKTRKETERAALVEAKRNALEFAGSYINNNTVVEDFALKSDIIKSFAAGEVKILEILARDWQPPRYDCYQVTVRAEVIPKPTTTPTAEQNTTLMNNPQSPLQVELWTNQQSFRAGQRMQIFLKANKDFYGRLVYTDTQQTQLQILPNPLRKDNLFRGGQVYQVPSEQDAFALQVQEPFGDETLTLFASTHPLGNLESTEAGAVYSLAGSGPDIAEKSRGLSLVPVAPGTTQATRSATGVPVAEFSEQQLTVTTSP